MLHYLVEDLPLQLRHTPPPIESTPNALLFPAQYVRHPISTGINSLKGFDIIYGMGLTGTDIKNMLSSADIANMSVGFPGLIEHYIDNDESLDEKDEVRAALNNFANILAQSGRSNKAILVWAAGNAHGLSCTAGTEKCSGGMLDASSPEILAGLPHFFNNLKEHSIAVVSVDSSGSIASSSNRCGLAKDYCIAAPGEGVDVLSASWDCQMDGMGECTSTRTNIVHGTAQVSGTSFAAPVVSGGLALMKQYFRSRLANTKLVDRLFSTADKQGAYADSSIYGQGLIDLGAALSPVGGLAAPSSSQVGGPSRNLDSSKVVTSSTFGDGLFGLLGNQELVAIDKLGAPFWFDVAEFVHVENSPRLQKRLRRILELQPTTFSARETDSFSHSPNRFDAFTDFDFGENKFQLGLVSNAGKLGINNLGFLQRRTLSLAYSNRKNIQVSAFITSSGESSGNSVTGLTYLWKPSSRPIALRFGGFSDKDGLLGSSTDGVFGKLTSNVAYFGFQGAKHVGNWRILADAEFGFARPVVSDGIIRKSSLLVTSAFGVTAAYNLPFDETITISLRQPLRLESGYLELSIPSDLTLDGTVVHTLKKAKLTPSGRELNISVEWRKSFSSSSELILDTGWTYQRNHQRDFAPEAHFIVGWRNRF